MKKHSEDQKDRAQRNSLDERALRLLEAFSDVDEELLERSEQSHKVVQISAFRRNVIKYGRACVAVVCLVAAGLLTWGGYRMGADNAGMSMESAIEDAIFDKSNETAMPIPDAENNTQSAGGMDETMEKVTAESAVGEADENGKVEAVVSGEVESANDGITTKSEYNAVSNSGEREGVTSGDGSGVMVSPEMKVREITLEEAYKIEGLGEYVPTVLPAGYALENVYVSESVGYYDQEEPQGVTVCWSKGMDSIFWHVSREDAATLHIVDVEKTETYDEYLYEIPHAETVPEEYREIFDNPVCRYEDFSLKFVEKRMINRGTDAGDTDTPRGSFSVLYPEGVVVEFNGRGTAQEVWEMFRSITKH